MIDVRLVIECDYCGLIRTGRMLESGVKDFTEEMKVIGWWFRKVDVGFLHYCSDHCRVEGYKAKQREVAG